MILDKILTSGIEFRSDESRLKYRYTLVNAMFIVGIVIALIAMLLRLSMHEYKVAAVDFSLALVFTGALFYLRANPRAIETVTTFMLTAAYFAFTALLFISHDSAIKLLWYALLIHAAFMTKGIRAGLTTYGAVIATLSTLYIFQHLYPQSPLQLDLSQTALIITMLFYSIVTLYTLFATLEQQKSLDSLQKANNAIEEQKQKLFTQMRTFALTGLPNSLALNEKLATLGEKDAAVITMVIDDFVTLADEFGTDIAHKIIGRSATLIQRFSEKHISLYQVAPYQFSFLIEKASTAQAINFAESIKRYFDQIDVAIDDQLEISLSFSMGIATGHPSTLVTHANTAMHQALHSGMNNYRLFIQDKKREQERKNNIYWNRKIKEIINQNRLRVYYQPIVDNRTGAIVKYESLIRALDGDTIVPPFQFLQALKTRGMLPTITKFVIKESFRYFSANDIEFTINITAEDLTNNYLVEYLIQQSKQHNIDPSRVYLEILESLTADQTEGTIAQFELLKKIGFQIAIDDFGAESSNLSRLLTYDADIIKIDAQFIKHLDTDPNSVKIVETIVSLSHKLGAKTVAEFVHSEAIYEIVRELGVDYSQGYYLGAPQPEIIDTSLICATI